jgi:hypothetical protein
MSADVPRSSSVFQAQALNAPATVPIRVAMMYLIYHYLSLLLRWSGVIALSVAREAVMFPRRPVPNIERNAPDGHHKCCNYCTILYCCTSATYYSKDYLYPHMRPP